MRSRRFDDGVTRAVGDLLERAIRAGVAPGLAAGWLTADTGRRQIVVAGHAFVGVGAPQVTTNTLYDLASLTKPLATTTLALLLFRSSALGPETRVGEVLSETLGWPLGDRRVADLLTHSAGLPAWEPLYALTSGDRARVIHALADLDLAASSRQVIYSCPGFITLGLVLERITGTGLADLFTDHIAATLEHTEYLGFCPKASALIAGGAVCPSVERDLLRERQLDPRSIPPVSSRLPDDGNARFLGGAAGNAGLFGTVSGVLDLARAYLTPGLLSADEIALATRNHTPDLEQARGFGWQLASSPGCSAGSALHPAAFGHVGFTGTSLWIDPTRDLAMALLANRHHPGHRCIDLHPLRRRFHRLIIGGS